MPDDRLGALSRLKRNLTTKAYVQSMDFLKVGVTAHFHRKRFSFLSVTSPGETQTWTVFLLEASLSVSSLNSHQSLLANPRHPTQPRRFKILFVSHQIFLTHPCPTQYKARLCLPRALSRSLLSRGLHGIPYGNSSSTNACWRLG